MGHGASKEEEVATTDDAKESNNRTIPPEEDIAMKDARPLPEEEEDKEMPDRKKARRGVSFASSPPQNSTITVKLKSAIGKPKRTPRLTRASPKPRGVDIEITMPFGTFTSPMGLGLGLDVKKKLFGAMEFAEIYQKALDEADAEASNIVVE